METLRAELARAMEQARRSDAAALKAAKELKAEQAAHRQSEDKIAKMAVELKDAAGRYELLEKESQAKAVDLEKAMVAAKETRSKMRAAKEELRGWEALFVADEVRRSEVCPSGSIMECCRRVRGLGNECC